MESPGRSTELWRSKSWGSGLQTNPHHSGRTKEGGGQSQVLHLGELTQDTEGHKPNLKVHLQSLMGAE